ncbi:MAG: hypothetical protein ACXACR_03070 [Candidatus Hodarchaeales archaeon]|jgi:hypothetical protein
MVVEELSCPFCGKLTEIATPSTTEITQIKGKSFWNIFVSSGYGTRMITICKHCEGKLSIWYRKKKNKS